MRSVDRNEHARLFEHCSAKQDFGSNATITSYDGKL